MFLTTFETLAKQEIQQIVCDLPDQTGGFGGQRSKKTVFASSISSKFRQLPDVSEDIEKEWLLFRSAIISSAAESCRRKRLRVAGDSEKRTPWWNQEVKEAIRAKKDAFKAWLQDTSSSDLQSRYTEARKMATSAVKKSKEKSWEEFGRRLDSNYFLAKKVFWQTIRRLRGKRSSITYSIKNSDGAGVVKFRILFWLLKSTAINYCISKHVRHFL